MPTVCLAALVAGWRCHGAAALGGCFDSQIPSKALIGISASFDYCNCHDYGSRLQIPNPERKKGDIFQPLIG
jgi:hypothetical protein